MIAPLRILLRPAGFGVLAVLLTTGSIWTMVSGQSAARVLQPSAVVYEGFRDIHTNGDDTTYGQGLTHRYVDGELRFLTIAHPDQLHEFRIAATAYGGTVTETTGTWDLSDTDGLNNFNGIWYEQAENRLWITSAEDYTATEHPARITTLTLGTNGVIGGGRTTFIDIPAKRVYGGCAAVPAALIGSLGGPYVCGWGGYTSLLNNGGGASIGATMYAIPDPRSVPDGGEVRPRTVLDHAESRGVRKTIPNNRFDDGEWLSPNGDGLGWMVWGDSYYNTGVWIGTSYVAVASLCKGTCWYEDSTLHFDGRQFELHIWDGARLGRNRTERPSSMTELPLPVGNDRIWEGNVTAGNIAGATYDPLSGRLYMVGFPLGDDSITGRLYTFRVDLGAPGAPPVDAIVSPWSEWRPVSDWTSCSGGQQVRTEERTRTVVAAPVNGGTTPELRETRSESRACGGSTQQQGRLYGSLVARGIDRPVGFVPHPLDDQVQLVLSQTGRIRVLVDGDLAPADFIDLTAAVGIGAEQGLLGLAFDPAFGSNRRVFVCFTDRSGHLVVSRFSEQTGGQFRLDPDTRFDLRWPGGDRFVPQPFTARKGGHLAFGADGYLYVGLGDGGSAGIATDTAQQAGSLLGKMLRVDVAVPDSDDRGYRIPGDNPFAGRADVLPEIWAAGLRNPWRWSFDEPARGGTAALIIADVGQDGWEEINYQPAGAGGRNYGWPYREGRHPYAAGSADPGAFVEPIWEYGRDSGGSIIGGHVYRGQALGPAFRGRYFFADHESSRVWSMALQVDAASGEATASGLTEHTAELGQAAVSPVSFGVDAPGELYIVSYLGAIYRLDLTAGNSRSSSSPPLGTARPR